MLIRPEQSMSAPARTGRESQERSLAIDFHGHDTVIKVIPGTHGVPSPIVARILGGQAPQPGTAVRLTVRGSVTAWPTAPPA